MNRTAWVWTVIVLFVVIVAVWYLAGNRSASQNAGAAATTTASSTTAATSGAGATGRTGTRSGANSFRSIFAGTANTECTYDQVGTTSGHSVVRIADGKMYGEFRTTTASTSNATLMIYSGGSLYTWKEAATTGTKTSIRSIADLADAIPADLTSASILGTTGDNNVGWNCHPWSKNLKQFTIPSYVTFSAR